MKFLVFALIFFCVSCKQESNPVSSPDTSTNTSKKTATEDPKKQADRKYREAKRAKRKDPLKAIQLFEESAKMGKAHAFFQVGLIYKKGAKGVAKNSMKAIEYFKKGAEADDFASMFQLAWAYAKGLGIEKNKEKALYWFEKCIEKEKKPCQDGYDLAYGPRFFVYYRSKEKEIIDAPPPHNQDIWKVEKRDKVYNNEWYVIDTNDSRGGYTPLKEKVKKLYWDGATWIDDWQKLKRKKPAEYEKRLAEGKSEHVETTKVMNRHEIRFKIRKQKKRISDLKSAINDESIRLKKFRRRSKEKLQKELSNAEIRLKKLNKYYIEGSNINGFPADSKVALGGFKKVRDYVDQLEYRLTNPKHNLDLQIEKFSEQISKAKANERTPAQRLERLQKDYNDLLYERKVVEETLKSLKNLQRRNSW